MTTNEQLQQRCLEFAGFKYKPGWQQVCGQVTHPMQWHDPNGTSLSRNPNFPESVDAHVKWIFDKLFADGYEVNISGNDTGFEAYIRKLDKSNSQLLELGIGNEGSPALAICKAIWELTEKENV